MKGKIIGRDVKLIPHFIPLVDQGGVVYPIRVCIIKGEDEETSFSGKAKPRIIERAQDTKKRSYADMARSN